MSPKASKTIESSNSSESKSIETFISSRLFQQALTGQMLANFHGELVDNLGTHQISEKEKRRFSRVL